MTDSKSNDSQVNQQTTNGYKIQAGPKLDPIARILLCATYDDNHMFSTFRGMRYIIKAIWEYVLQFNAIHWKSYIKTDETSFQMKSWRITFPPPQNININMMPFVMNSEFKNSKLPKYLKLYWPIIRDCIDYNYEEANKICFLTIQESSVDAGCTQRRPGLHTETPAQITIYNDTDEKNNHNYIKGGGMTNKQYYSDLNWGRGGYLYNQEGGIFIASSVECTTSVWNCKIIKNEELNHEAIGYLGDIEHLRRYLPGKSKRVLQGCSLYWITDRTPHEALAVEKETYRQFFRLVTHNVSLWHEKYSTTNPNGVVPDPKITTVVTGDKFKSNQII